MRILNLYSGLGGNRKLWEGHQVTAIEMNREIAEVYKKQFPNDTVIIGDAHKYLEKSYGNYDFIWSSPPCQTHSKMMKATKWDVVRYPDMSLYQQIILLQNFCEVPWVVENVKPYYSLLIQPSIIMDRHCFWSNFYISGYNLKSPKDFITGDSPEQLQAMKDWLGINYKGNIYYGDNHSPGQVLRNCVHPQIGQHVLNCAMGSPINMKEMDLFK